MKESNFKPTSYKLKCLECGKEFERDHHLLACDEDHRPAFLRAWYEKKQLELREDASGMFRYGDWLPLRRPIGNQALPIAYRSDGFGPRLGLSDLWIVFSGYWPEREADMRTCTFKEQEAPPVCSRLPDTDDTMVLASAGNTARAFAEICSANHIPLLMIVHQAGLENMWSSRPFSDSVKLVGVIGDADYFDAIKLSQMISVLPCYLPEGGAKNVARRDGMGVSVLAAAVTAGRIPDHYFQGVGSGTGGISAWEASMRLRADGRFGDVKMKLHLVQNHPFTPITDAWRALSPELLEMNDDDARARIAQISAFVLSNRRPPYSVRGGVYDALKDTDGRMYSVTNRQAKAAGELFEQTEGIDIDPAAAVAAGALMEEARKGTVPRKDMILLNVTGGGQKRLFSEHKINYLRPYMTIHRDEITEEKVRELFG